MGGSVGGWVGASVGGVSVWGVCDVDFEMIPWIIVLCGTTLSSGESGWNGTCVKG